MYGYFQRGKHARIDGIYVKGEHSTLRGEKQRRQRKKKINRCPSECWIASEKDK